MEYNINTLNIVSLKAAFVDAEIDKVCNDLISYSTSIENNEIKAQIIVMESIAPSDEDGILDILGDIVGHFRGVKADLQLLKIGGGRLITDSDTLPIKLFRRVS